MVGGEPGPGQGGEPAAPVRPVAQKGSVLQLLVLFGAMTALGLVVLIGGGIYWFATHGKQFVETTEQKEREGIAYGQAHDADACVGETLRQTEDCWQVDVGCMSRGQIFLFSCLSTAAGVDELCEGAPKPLDLIDGSTFQSETCKRHHSKSGRVCMQMAQAVLMYCDQRSKGGMLASEPDPAPGSDEAEQVEQPGTELGEAEQPEQAQQAEQAHQTVQPSAP